MFCRNEKVMYPGYGVATIQDIIIRYVGGNKSEFFQLKFVSKDMTILVPIEKIDMVKLRKLCDERDIARLCSLLSEPFSMPKEERLLTVTWSKRYKDYQEKIQSGNIEEICSMYRELKNLEAQKDLSFGEKTILLQIENLLAEEVSIVQNCKYVTARDMIKNLVVVQLKLSGMLKADISNQIRV